MVFPVVLVHASVERSALAHRLLLALLLFPLILLVFEEHGVLVTLPLVVTEESATCQSSDLWLRLAPNQVTILLVIHHFSNGIGQKVGRQISQRGVVTNSKAPHDSVLLLIGEVVQELGQVW